MKIQQLALGIFWAMLGIAMIIHFWGDLGIMAIISDIVGIALITIGVFSALLFFRRRNQNKARS